MPPPPFANPRWRKRASHSSRIHRRLWYDPDDEYEYEPDPYLPEGTWHQIDWRNDRYRELDGETGVPIAGSEGQWRPLR